MRSSVMMITQWSSKVMEEGGEEGSGSAMRESGQSREVGLTEEAEGAIKCALLPSHKMLNNFVAQVLLECFALELATAVRLERLERRSDLLLGEG